MGAPLSSRDRTASMEIQNLTFKEGKELKLRVKPKDDCCRFSINIGHDSVIVCNSMSGGCWGDEHNEFSMPFCCGEECKFYINFNMEHFYIKLPDGNMMSFPNRLGDVKYKYFQVYGDCKLVGLKI